MFERNRSVGLPVGPLVAEFRRIGAFQPLGRGVARRKLRELSPTLLICSVRE
jgi:hypothetical protein